MIGHNNPIAESRGRFVVCTVEYCTVDSIVNAKVSEERCEEIHVLRRSPSRRFVRYGTVRKVLSASTAVRYRTVR